VFGGPYDDYMRRYHTYEEALAGHKEIFNMCWKHYDRTVEKMPKGFETFMGDPEGWKKD
jgi:hypothetical protein